ncbi:MAG: iron-sulfur cluster assembly accessory protein [Hyphomicrobium sp.]
MTDATPISKPRPRPQVMTLTDAARARVEALMRKEPAVAGLKVGVKKGGCAGMEYTMSLVDKVERFDEVVESGKARVIIDPSAVLYLIGTEMDFKTDKLSAQFVFNNPNQKSSCGCGESVNLVPATPSRFDGSEG